MNFCARLTLRPDTEDAAHDLCVGLKQQEFDLALLFATHHYGPAFETLVQGIYNNLNCRNLIGCTAESIVGPTAEIEGRPAVALWLGHLPGVRVVPFLLDQEDIDTLAEAEPAAWHDRVGVTPDDKPCFIVLPDAATIDVGNCLGSLDAVFAGATIVGGVASGAQTPGKNRLFLGETCLRRGLVGVSLSGPVHVEAVVSQGCRPVGEPFVVTKVRDNLIVELGGKPALGVLREIFNQANPSDQVLMQNGLHVGRLVDEQQRNGGEGAYLIRNMAGITQSEALAVYDYFRPGQTVQFHVRDARTADDEMVRLLQQERGRHAEAPQGALLFTCNGRGQRFFKKPNHDISLVNTIVGECPTAGFFAGGEIGPIGGRTFIHGFTSSLILFRPVA